MSANLIGFGCDLQQKLDKMPPRDRKARWAGDVGVELYRIARKLHRVSEEARDYGTTPAAERREKRLVEQAQEAVNQLGKGIKVFRQPDPAGWPLYIVFPRDVPPRSEMGAYFEKGIAVPPGP